MKPVNLLYLLLAIIALLPIFIMTYTENIDPFSFSTAGLAQTYSKAESYFPYPYKIENSVTWQFHANEVSMRIVPVLLLVMLENVTGLSISTLLFIPLIGIFFALLIFLIAKQLVKSTIVSLLLVIVMNFTFFPINIHYISVGLCLFLFFVFTWLKFMDSHENKSSIVFILLIVFIAIYYSYYTAEFLVFCLLFAALVFPWIIKKTARIKVTQIKLGSLLICFLIIFVYFDHQFYNYFLYASPENISASLGSYFEYVLHFLQAGSTAITDYRPQISNSATVFADFFQRSLFIITLTLYSLYFAKNWKKTNPCLSYKGIAFLSLFFVGIMQILLYSSVGYSQHIWSLYLVSTLASFYALNTFIHEIKKQKLFSALFIIMMLLIVSSGATIFALKVTDPVNPNGYRLYSLMQPAVSWCVSNLDSGYIASDSRTAAQLFLETTKVSKENAVYPYRLSSEVSYLYSSGLDMEVPQKLFGNKSVCFLISYEFKTHSFLAGNQWSYCPPLGTAFSYLDAYPFLNKVYDDGKGLVYTYDGSNLNK